MSFIPRREERSEENGVQLTLFPFYMWLRNQNLTFKKHEQASVFFEDSKTFIFRYDVTNRGTYYVTSSFTYWVTCSYTYCVTCCVTYNVTYRVTYYITYYVTYCVTYIFTYCATYTVSRVSWTTSTWVAILVHVLFFSAACFVAQFGGGLARIVIINLM